ncbi:MAG: rRNA maturation RNase YbeY [Pseudomonadota bacterium]
MNVEIVLEDMRWAKLQLDDLCEAAIAATLAHLSLPADRAGVSVLACNDARISELNKAFRDKQAATNVLSWPTLDRAADAPGGIPVPPKPAADGSMELGDIALSYDTCVREALENGKCEIDHVTHLIVHSTLHLLGFDHEDDADADLMERLEREIIGKMGLDDPYLN